MANSDLYLIRKAIKRRTGICVLLRKYRHNSNTFSIGIKKSDYKKALDVFNRLALVAEDVTLSKTKDIYIMTFYKETLQGLPGYILLN